MGYVTRDMLLKPRLPIREVEVPEWDATVRIQQWSISTREGYLTRVSEAYEAQAAYLRDLDAPEEERQGLAEPKQLNSAGLAILTSLVDEEGAPLLADADPDIINDWPHAVAQRLFRATVALNGLNGRTSDDIETEKKG